MAHEAGHVVARHSARAMVSQMGLQTVTQAALGQNPSAVASIAAQLVSGGTPGYTVSGGALPSGALTLTLNTSTGVVSATGKTPTTPPTTYSFPITITDAGGGSVSGTVVVTLT